MRNLALVALLLLAACAGGDGAAPSAPAPAPDSPPDTGSTDADTGASVGGSTGSGEILCPEPSPGTLPEPGCEPPPEPGKSGTGGTSAAPAAPQAAELVTPRPGMAGTRPIPWTGAEPVGDGATLRITWISGVEPCSVLDRVELAETATEVRVTLIEGSDPAVSNVVCIELGVPKAVEVPLAAPLGDRTLVDGAV